jgi:SEC-C motif-containing protein
MTCDCGSGIAFESCCGPFLAGAAAPTAEALLRSRYTAFVRGDVDYIVSTHAARTRSQIDRSEIEHWSRQSRWQGLEILHSEPDDPTAGSAQIEFVARFHLNGQDQVHHELASFVREDGRWFFLDGAPPKSQPRRVEPKPGRNDPCPCGSGKKFKKCCGAAA